jgi:hypothetical protein
MAKTYPNQYFPEMPRIAQANPFYCGPTVMEMLLKYRGVHHLDQNELAQISGVGDRIFDVGMTLSEMANTINSLELPVQFWFKTDSNLKELGTIINDYQQPVGVEWQGVFDYDDDEIDEDGDDDPGHYSIVTYCSTYDNQILIADPDHHYAGSDRRFSVMQFERRWWDINSTRDPYTGAYQETEDYHALYVIVPKEEIWPTQLDMKLS